MSKFKYKMDVYDWLKLIAILILIVWYVILKGLI